jgi:ribosome biogenesis GTP-binding protein YlqF
MRSGGRCPSCDGRLALRLPQRCHQWHQGSALKLHARLVDVDEELSGVKEMQDLSLNRHSIQWYPGHIAKAERQLKEQLSKVDIVFDVRDARILESTTHPRMAEWTQNKRRFVLINRTDMVSKSELKMWQKHYAAMGQKAFMTNGQAGNGVDAVIKAADQLSAQVNAGRLRRGLKPRNVRACVVGFPNIGKSALINRLLKRKVVASEARPGVTKVLRWVRMGDTLDLLDSPGIIPGSLKDQSAAAKLAICNDIGEASYVNSSVAAAFLIMVQQLPVAQKVKARIQQRYSITLGNKSAEDFVWQLADQLFQGDVESAGARILADYRSLRLGMFALEHPPPVQMLTV